MTINTPLTAGDDPATGIEKALSDLRVLLVDDSAAQLQLLKSILKRSGYDAVCTGSAQDALNILDDARPTVVVCDWMMPEMSGPEFCKQVRAVTRTHYVYILILTSLKDRNAPAHVLEVGADDFLAKPVNPHELRARIRAGIRIVEMQAQLLAQNQATSDALDELSAVYAAVERDLSQARMLQQALLPTEECRFGGFHAGFLLRSAGKVGGDLVGHFAAGPGRLGLYSIDVSGHGVASALLSARLAGMFSQSADIGGVAITRDQAGQPIPRNGVDITRAINDRLLADIDTELYLTLALVIVDEQHAEIELVQAGHPHPLIRRADGQVERVGQAGLPVGLVFNAEYQAVRLTLNPGDQLFLHTDGFTECVLPNGDMLGEAELEAIFARMNHRGAPTELLGALVSKLTEAAGTEDFGDDVSGVMIEALAAPTPQNGSG
ncbi:MAG: fused response regulator/phosphatase [Pseudomonadota bacterium]